MEDSRRERLVFFWIKSALASITFICLVFLVYGLGPFLETKYFPVLEKLQIIEVKPEGKDKARVLAAFKKLRECEYVGIAWYWKKADDSFERVPLVLMRKAGDNSSPNRPLGYQTSGPWEVSIPADQVLFNSFVEVFHNCWPFWTTRTKFYP